MAIEQHEQFHNISFKEFVMALKGVLYGYSIEHDADNDVYDLSIYSTSLSELDEEDKDDGLLESFSYMEENEVFDDLGSANLLFSIEFEKI